MGRKKGKQRGQFSSKVQRAEVDARHRAVATSSSCAWIDPRYGQSSSVKNTNSSGGQQKSQLQQLKEERGTVSLTLLRGLLRERRMEDTIEYQQARRRNLTRPAPSTADKDSSAVKTVKLFDRHDPGWILNYGDTATTTSSNRYKQQDTGQRIPSLQSMCVEALGPALSAYTDSYGIDTMRAVLDTLPPAVLAGLSISVSSRGGGVDDSLVTVLGLHNHVEKLALHSMQGRVTAKGILSIVPRIVTERQEENTTNRDNEELLESWEDAVSSVIFDGCTRLTRLELCDLQVPFSDDDSEYERAVTEETELLNAVTKLLRLCPRITHLSLSGSFRSYQCGFLLLKNIPCLLPKLSVLDLSHCTWMDDTLMHSFLSDLVALTSVETPGKDDSEAVRMINVAGCQNISEDKICSMQEKFNSGTKPDIVIATNVEKKNRSW